jgi:hypothetical protein
MLERRAFLASLAALPMLGGSVALIGQPTAAAVRVTDGLLRNYEAWLAWERYDLQRELWGEAVAIKSTTFLAVNLPGEQWHRPWRDGETCPEPSTRAALVLSAVGCPLDEKRSLYADLDVRRGI